MVGKWNVAGKVSAKNPATCKCIEKAGKLLSARSLSSSDECGRSVTDSFDIVWDLPITQHCMVLPSVISYSQTLAY